MAQNAPGTLPGVAKPMVGARAGTSRCATRRTGTGGEPIAGAQAGTSRCANHRAGAAGERLRVGLGEMSVLG